MTRVVRAIVLASLLANGHQAWASRETSHAIHLGAALIRMGGGKWDSAWTHKARLTTVWEKEDDWRLEFGLEAALLQGRGAAKSGPGPFQAQNRVEDFNPFPIQENNWSLRTNLDRLSIRKNFGKTTVTLGRQAIGHGNGRYFNPTDLFAPMSPFGINTDYKSGVDAVVVERSINENQDLGFWWATHRQGLGEGSALLRYRRTTESLDLSFLGGRMAREPLVAWDVSGQLGGKAWYTEGLMSFGKGRKDRQRLAGGLHWIKPSGLQVLLEWQRNSAGAQDGAGLVNMMGQQEWRDGQVFLTGRWHGALLLSDEYAPLKSWSFLAVRDVTGSSWLVSPGLQFDLSETQQLKVGIQKGWGRGPRPFPGVGSLPQSDFGGVPWVIFGEWVINR